MKRLLTTALSLLFVVSAAFGFSACGESGGGGQTGAKTYALTLSSDNAAAGTVSGGGEFEEGASVTATAAANTGFKLDGWYTSDDTLKSALAAYTFLMPASALSLKAKFSALSDGGEEPEEPDDSGWNIKVGDGTNGVRAGLHYLEYGEYPGSFVGTALNTTLEGLYNGGSISAQLTAAGSYKTNGNSTSAANKTYTSKENYAYTYQDAKYVRVSIVPYTESTGSYTYSTNDTVGEKGTINWFKVEPLRWIILNYDKLPKNINPSGSAAATQLELLTVEEIMSNIPFGEKPTINDGLTYAQWKESIIRTWLNGEFYNAAFGVEERAAIPQTHLGNNMPSDHAGTDTYNYTDDYIFLLSYHDIKSVGGKYVGTGQAFQTGLSDTSRNANPSDFALANYIRNLDGVSTWWLRSASTGTTIVTAGRVSSYDKNDIIAGIRPALNVTL